MMHRHRSGFAAPYHLRPAALIVFDGGRGTGKTTQLSRLRRAQEAPQGGRPLFSADPLFLRVPNNAGADRDAATRRALQALAAERPVFSEGWDYSVLVPDVVLMFPPASSDSGWPRVLAERIVPLPHGHEGEVGLAIWTCLAARRLYGPCTCSVGVTA